MALGSLRIFDFCNSRHRDPIKQDSPILDLPMEIIYGIFNELSISANILLSQSCRHSHYQLLSECYTAVSNASAVKRLKCLAVLGDILPDHRLCIGCNALRFIATKDLPVIDFRYHKPRLAIGSLWRRRRLLL